MWLQNAWLCGGVHLPGKHFPSNLFRLFINHFHVGGSYKLTTVIIIMCLVFKYKWINRIKCVNCAKFVIFMNVINIRSWNWAIRCLLVLFHVEWKCTIRLRTAPTAIIERDNTKIWLKFLHPVRLRMSNQLINVS